MKSKSPEQYQFEKDMDAIFDEAYFAFLERYKKYPSSAETYIRYLKEVLFLIDKSPDVVDPAFMVEVKDGKIQKKPLTPLMEMFLKKHPIPTNFPFKLPTSKERV